ncbi:IclR family transcriptional regulator domain-containing protein [Noviherbaspirillum saxi]|uniref:Transcriptional regulator n=1 Tax=Noviherbaspirillum saxi TaxID=2320863 RepID=A0A3A3FHU8_9BURK|nr:IclR family transcriptional regulator C-terminal domain-containing protein [Noviherbaspirillum saxi]RJF95078.1 transcriptional regulator [Noviherbaspirillum saxi]
MAQEPSSSYRHCQSLVKGLDILAALNRRSSASASITELGRMTGLHRTTIKRLLETLRQAGYVECDAATNLYRLTFRIQQLSYGFRDNVQISEIAWPQMRVISKALVWPCSLVSLEGDEMVVRASTRPYSPLSFHSGMPGRRMPLLTTAAGRAYLAFAPEEEQKVLLDMLRERSDIDAVPAKDAHFIRTLLSETRQRGYALNRGEWNAEPKFGGVAVPLKFQDRVLACLNVIFLIRAVKDESALSAIASELLAHAKIIEQGFAAYQQRSA